MLRDIAAADVDRVTFRQLVLGLRHRAFGFTMLAFALPSCLPMPPGIPTVCGIALAIIALNLLAARRRLWLPRAIAHKSMAHADMKRFIDRALPHLERLERICRPRIPVVTGRFGKFVIGAMVLLLAVLMILPIPFLGNMPPAIATAVIAIGLIERDGIVVLVGLFLAALAIAITSAALWAAMLGVVGLLTG